jgi:hypothetical protein
MSILDEDLSDQQEHALLEIERPNVNCSSVLNIIIELFLRLQDGEQVAK